MLLIKKCVLKTEQTTTVVYASVMTIVYAILTMFYTLCYEF